MGKIYAGIQNINPPEISEIHSIDKYFKDCEEFVKKIKVYAKYHGSGKEAGEEISFPVADGHARYVILSIKPVKLIHLNVGDAWQYQYINRLTTSDIKKELKKQKEWKSFLKKAHQSGQKNPVGALS
jgi:hypothetical protein